LVVRKVLGRIKKAQFRASGRIKSWCQKKGVPFRTQVNFIDSFFRIPSVEQVSIENLISIIRNLPEGVSELMCHPGMTSPDLKSSYSKQRELELKVLTSSRVKQEIERLGTELINWKQI